VVQETPREERDLARAIALGVRRRPEQAFGHYFEGRRASCALGAVYDGLYWLSGDPGRVRVQELFELFDCLEGTIRRCPEGCRKRVNLASLIVHLNDDHHWSREQVASWLAGEVGPPPAPAATRKPPTGGLS
jgi:hypothetical protein